jgi:hypothetical protein
MVRSQSIKDSVITDLVKRCIALLHADEAYFYSIDTIEKSLFDSVIKCTQTSSSHYKGININLVHKAVQDCVKEQRTICHQVSVVGANGTLGTYQVAVPVFYGSNLCAVLAAAFTLASESVSRHLEIMRSLANQFQHEQNGTKIYSDNIVQNFDMARTATAISEVQVMALRTQLSPHFTFNSLNVIISLIRDKENKQAEIYLTKFSKLLRKILSGSTQVTTTISDQVELLTHYLDFEKIRFEGKLHFSLMVDSTLSPHAEEIPYLLPYILTEMMVTNVLSESTGDDNWIIIKYKRGIDAIEIELQSVFGWSKNNEASLLSINEIVPYEVETLHSLKDDFPGINFTVTKRTNESLKATINIPYAR